MNGRVKRCSSKAILAALVIGGIGAVGISGVQDLSEIRVIDRSGRVRLHVSVEKDGALLIRGLGANGSTVLTYRASSDGREVSLGMGPKIGDGAVPFEVRATPDGSTLSLRGPNALTVIEPGRIKATQSGREHIWP